MSAEHKPNVYYISSGEQNKMYTLRCRIHSNPELGTRTGDGYVRNLSTDIDKAVEKAKRIFCITAQIGDVLHTDGRILNEITRRSHEEMEELRREAEKRAKRKEQEQLDYRDKILSQVDPTIVPFGKYRNVVLDEVFSNDADYCWWLLDNFSSDVYYHQPFKKYLTDFMSNKQRPFKWKREDSNYFGFITEKVEFEGIVEVKVLVGIDSPFGGKMLYKIRLDNGDVVTTFYTGSRWSADRGERVKGKGVVKEHKLYEGEKQTILQRVNLEVQEIKTEQD